MPRRIALACLGLLLVAGSARAQVGFGTSTIPPRRALARVNLDMQWHGIVPLDGAEKLTELSIDAGMLFAQTNLANFYAFDAETGRYLWAAHLGRVTSKAEPASVNSFGVFVTNSNVLFALDRRTGREMWKRELHDNSSSATNADDTIVTVGLDSGKLVTFDAKTGNEKWNIQTNERVSSRPLVAGRVIAFGSEDKKLYLSRSENSKLLWRFAAGGPITAPLSGHGVRTLLMASTDKNVYAVDLFTGESRWTFASGAPINQEPIVVDNDVYVVNTEGYLSEIDVLTGQSRWTISTLGGRLLSVSATRIYLESHDDDLFVVDRQSGKIVYDPMTTFQRAGINVRNYTLGPTNRLDDRLYFGDHHWACCSASARSISGPRGCSATRNAKPLGFIPIEGYTTEPVPPVADRPGDQRSRTTEMIGTPGLPQSMSLKAASPRPSFVFSTWAVPRLVQLCFTWGCSVHHE